ncbi:MAG: SPOR domain-containing protein [Xanthomonadales bacterium]|nr:SPOR domain-containing protein [Gammaproteobacteria bacterium]MBT8054220.1 SPOR domain-containing protein [Gammaproteobacteria bacterium]NND57587.1 SPOR domain-containing protein [Xanthomonadales bacterium]NNK51311.1 SPOR domain-containing protein [Xanthomonadales bacterium]
MPAARRRPSGKNRAGTPAWLWLLAGILVGLGLAWFLWSKGYIPQPEAISTAAEESSPEAGPDSTEEVAPANEESGKSRYDFFTVLPEMEVVVPEQELSGQSQLQENLPAQAETPGDYLLQVGSFQNQPDAEQLKARLALLGFTAQIQTVTVNDAKWHRVRVGPVNGARRADEMRRQLNENGIDSLVMKNQ